MSDLVVRRLDSLAELRRAARAWDELWERSEIALPTARAELLTLWCEHFAAGRPLRAIVVEQEGQFVAALPLLTAQRGGLRLARLPQNQWSPAGDLLLDPTADGDRVCDVLVSELTRDAWPLAWLDGLPGEARRWQLFCAALDRQHLSYVTRRRFQINQVHLERDWQTYFGSRSRNHRRHVRKSLTLAQRGGDTALVCYDELAPHEVEPILRCCFEMEARGWKDRAEGAVLSVPGVWQFYLEQAQQLAALGQLSVAVLEHAGRPIAFEYGWLGKGVYFSPKVGYDEAFGSLSPGQLLRSFLIERAYREGEIEWFDFLGPASDATSKWATHAYPIDRVVVALHGAASRGFVSAYRHVGPWLHALRTGGRARDQTGAPRPIDAPHPAQVPAQPSVPAATG